MGKKDTIYSKLYFGGKLICCTSSMITKFKRNDTITNIGNATTNKEHFIYVFSHANSKVLEGNAPKYSDSVCVRI